MCVCVWTWVLVPWNSESSLETGIPLTVASAKAMVDLSLWSLLSLSLCPSALVGSSYV